MFDPCVPCVRSQAQVDVERSERLVAFSLQLFKWLRSCVLAFRSVLSGVVKLIKWLLMSVLFLLTVFVTVWEGMSVAMRGIQPAGWGLDTVLLLVLFGGLAALCLWGFYRLRR